MIAGSTKKVVLSETFGAFQPVVFEGHWHQCFYEKFIGNEECIDN